MANARKPEPWAKKQPTLMGKLLNRVRFERIMARERAEAGLWKRNNLENPKTREGYKLAETKVVYTDGKEVTELRLYKLIDAAVVTISSEVSSEIVDGIHKLRENNRDG